MKLTEIQSAISSKMKPIKDYTQQRGPSLPLRIFEEDKFRFDELTRRLVLASGGYQFSQAQVIKYLLDLELALEENKNET